jgi:STE24 endopeptidase
MAMHPIATIILTAMALDLAINLTADALNLKKLSSQLPETFIGWFDSRQYARSQQYVRATTRFGWVVTGVDLFGVLLFWFMGGFAWLDGWVRTLAPSLVMRGLLYIGLLLGLKAVLDLPFGIYRTFVIEARFGFNKTTWPTYIKDRIKGLFLSVLLAGPLLGAVLAFFRSAGPSAWWYCWGVSVAFMLAVQYIAPTWIMPLFNRFEPLPQSGLRDSITRYAESIDFALDNIFVMDGSKRSAKSNAFFTGFGRHRRIVLFDTLIKQHSVEELVAVLAHEMGHYKEKHILKNMVVGFVQAGVMFYILSLFISYPGLFHAFYLEQVSVYAGLVFFGMLWAPLDGIVGLALQAVSRRHEYAADRFAVSTGQNGSAMVSALKKLSVHNLSNLQPHPLYVFLHYSHPPVLKRIEVIEKMISG